MNSIKLPRTIQIGGKGQVKKLTLGGTSPILLQTMWKESLLGADLLSIVKSLNELKQLGCDIVRFAVPDMDSAEQFGPHRLHTGEIATIR